MNKIIPIYAILYLIILSGCTQSIKHEACTDYTIDTAYIPIDENYLQHYKFAQSQYYKEKLFTYNHYIHSIDIFDLNRNEPLSQIKLKREGPDGIPDIASFCITPTSILVENMAQYIILDFTGKVKKRISKDKLQTSIAEEDYLIIPKGGALNNLLFIVFNDSTNELIIPVFPKDPDDLANKYCLASVSLETENIKILPAPYPSFLTKNYYGMMNRPNILCKGDSIIYNFPVASNIYIYDRITEIVYEKNIKSEFTPNISESTERIANKELDHYLHSTFFHNIKYDKYRNQYYRLHVNRCDIGEAFNKRETYLTIIDKDFKKVTELRMTTPYTFSLYHVIPQGVFFEFAEDSNENNYPYMIITSENIQQVDYPQNELFIKLDSENELPMPTTDTVANHKKDNNTFFDIHAILSGREAYSEFLYKNMKYPSPEYENQIEGSVFICLIRDNEGNITTLEAESTTIGHITNSMTEEALRIFKVIQKIDPKTTDVTTIIQVPFDIPSYKRINNIID